MRPEGLDSGVARIFFNFSSSPPVTRLAEIFIRLFTSRFGFALTVSVAAIFLTVELSLVFFDFGALLSGDEPEHLHVVYALERGEVPYRDFLENHPVLFHLILLRLKRLFGLTDVGDAYLLFKAFVFLHFIACIVLLAWLLCRFCKWEFGAARPGLVFIVATPLLGMWGIEQFWDFRMDWVALFYAYAAVAAHLIMLKKIIQGQRYFAWLILGAVSFGLGAAVLAKVVYVIVPYVMTLCLAPVLAPRDGLKKFFSRLTPLFLINFVFAALALLFFAGFVALELAGSNASLTDYIRANYALNSIAFPPIGAGRDFNPFNTMRLILDLPALPAYILIMCGVPLFLALHERKKYFLKCLAAFIGLTILFNASFPAYSGSAASMHNFIPSAMAAALYTALLIIQLLHDAAPRLRFISCSGPGLTARQAFLALQLAAVFVALLYMAVASAYETSKKAMRVSIVTEERRQIMSAGGTFFEPDAFMPSSLKYLIFGPSDKPADAPAWGYFFFLKGHWRFWRSAHGAGFAPDPADHWRSLYEKDPPDAVAVVSLKQLQQAANKINFRQDVDVSWLLERVRKDYACITRGRPLYVRNDLAQAYLQQNGWRLCDERD